LNKQKGVDKVYLTKYDVYRTNKKETKQVKRIFYLCDGERENCKKRNCYKNGGDCRHTTDISHAMNFERRGKYKNGSFYEKEDVSRNETSSID
jgi:hypothetical protein